MQHYADLSQGWLHFGVLYGVCGEGGVRCKHYACTYVYGLHMIIYNHEAGFIAKMG